LLIIEESRGKCEIRSSFSAIFLSYRFRLSKQESFLVLSPGMRRNNTWPTEEGIARGTKVLCQIDRGADGHTGALWDEKGIIRWRYGLRKNGPGWGRGNPFNKRDFVVAEPDAGNEVIIRRDSFLPPVFNIIGAGTIIGTIRMRSMFRNKYTIDIDEMNSLTFRMPLFTTSFYGESSVGTEVWVALGPSKMEWYILIKPGLKVWPLVPAVSFIHTEWWNYG